jgi:hypothetical protein
MVYLPGGTFLMGDEQGTTTTKSPSTASPSTPSPSAAPPSPGASTGGSARTRTAIGRSGWKKAASTISTRAATITTITTITPSAASPAMPSTCPWSASPGTMPSPTAPGLPSVPTDPTGCRPRRNGNTPAGPIPRPAGASATTRSTSATMVGIARMPRASCIRLAESGRILGACWTCTATSGSGVRIGMPKMPTASVQHLLALLQQMLQPVGATVEAKLLESIYTIPQALRRARTGSSAAAPGTTSPTSAVRRSATGTGRRSGAAASASVFRGPYSLALLPFYPWPAVARRLD